MGNPVWGIFWWTQTRNYSIQKVQSIPHDNREMLVDKHKIALVEHQGSGRPPAGGWQKFPARCLTVASK
jgi:hypothetical protein